MYCFQPAGQPEFSSFTTTYIIVIMTWPSTMLVAIQYKTIELTFFSNYLSTSPTHMRTLPYKANGSAACRIALRQRPQIVDKLFTIEVWRNFHACVSWCQNLLVIMSSIQLKCSVLQSKFIMELICISPVSSTIEAAGFRGGSRGVMGGRYPPPSAWERWQASEGDELLSYLTPNYYHAISA